jgi:RNA polymerase sigma-70 factor (ECF subfamily)
MNVTNRDSSLFSTMCRTHSAYVERILRKCGVPPEDVADVAQDMLLCVWCKFAQYDATRPIRPWLCAFAVHFARGYRGLSRHRREKLTAEFPDVPYDAPSAENMMMIEHDRRFALGAIERLSPRYRSVLMMHVEGLTMLQIAAALGIPIDTGYTRLRRALQMARRHVYRARVLDARAVSRWQESACRKRAIGEARSLPSARSGLTCPCPP